MNKKERQAAAQKKAKQKKIRAISLCAAIVLVIAAIVALSAYQQMGSRVFAYGNVSVTLRKNGAFTAALTHETRRGAYTEEPAEDGVVTVTFVVDGISVQGSIADNILTIPEAWDDGHGHGTMLTLQ